MTKSERQAMILQIVAAKDIETQEELMRELERRGIAVTQATISRDIKELGLTKVLGPGNRYRYVQIDVEQPHSSLDRMMRVMRNSVTGIDYTNNLIVLKTIAGGAHAVAAAVDNMDNEKVVGTLAGDDTVLIIMRTEQDAPILVNILRQMIE